MAIDGKEVEAVTDFNFLTSKSLRMVMVAMKLKDLLLGRKAMTNLMKVSVTSNTLRPPWTVTHQTPLFIEFSRQENWSGVPLPPLFQGTSVF